MPSQERVELPGSYREKMPGATASGPVDSSEIVRVTVLLRRREEAQTLSAEQFAYGVPTPGTILPVRSMAGSTARLRLTSPRSRPLPMNMA